MPLLLANAWDRGSAKPLESLDFVALATTSSGFAASELRDDETYGYWAQPKVGARAAGSAFG
jgi:2-methylisocitrate lyase-like PEP mutase family enzyme